MSHMGRFLLRELEREGVDTRGIVTDPERLTALVILGIRDQQHFPLIFYRENCADMALCEDDIDPAFIAETSCVLATGTHLSHPKTEAAVLKALHLARGNGSRTALDIDYRPNLWGLSGHGDGENRFIESAAVTAKLQSTLHLFDLHRRNGRGVPHRRRFDRYASGAESRARCDECRTGLQTRSDGSGDFRRPNS
jgi:5-dehydro-2-deoxygluconokinase